MSILTLGPFRGIYKSITPAALPSGSAISAEDAVLRSGDLLPIAKGEAAVQALPNANRRTLFRYERQGGGDRLWMNWPDPGARAVLGPLADDAHDRVYWTDSSYPKMASYDRLIDGVTDTISYPGGHYRLGIPAPVAPPGVVPPVVNETGRPHADWFGVAGGESGVRIFIEDALVGDTDASQWTLNLVGRVNPPAGTYVGCGNHQRNDHDYHGHVHCGAGGRWAVPRQCAGRSEPDARAVG